MASTATSSAACFLAVLPVSCCSHNSSSTLPRFFLTTSRIRSRTLVLGTSSSNGSRMRPARASIGSDAPADGGRFEGEAEDAAEAADEEEEAGVAAAEEACCSVVRESASRISSYAARARLSSPFACIRSASLYCDLNVESDWDRRSTAREAAEEADAFSEEDCFDGENGWRSPLECECAEEAARVGAARTNSISTRDEMSIGELREECGASLPR